MHFLQSPDLSPRPMSMGGEATGESGIPGDFRKLPVPKAPLDATQEQNHNDTDRKLCREEKPLLTFHARPIGEEPFSKPRQRKGYPATRCKDRNVRSDPPRMVKEHYDSSHGLFQHLSTSLMWRRTENLLLRP